MASWNDIKKYVKANFALEHETANLLGMNFRFEDGRTQKISLVYAGEDGVFGGEWAKFISPVAEFTPARLAKAAERLRAQTPSPADGVAPIDDRPPEQSAPPVAAAPTAQRGGGGLVGRTARALRKLRSERP